MAEKKISYKEILALHLPEQGGTIRHSHAACGDRRSRLYLTMPMGQPGVVLAFCHNCGCGGVARVGKSISNIHTTKVDVSNTRSFAVPTGMIALSRAPLALTYLNNYKLVARATAYGMEYDPTTSRLYIPRYTATGSEVISYQLRRLLPLEHEPKYLSVTNINRSTEPLDGILYTSGKSAAMSGSAGCVIVEDVLSGLCITEFSNYDALPLLGTHAARETLFALSQDYSQIVVWLDNDNGIVNKQRDGIAEFLKLLGHHSVRVVSDYIEPKRVVANSSQDSIQHMADGHPP